MAATGQKQWGMTPAVSIALPTESELQAKDALVEELKRQNQYESTADTQKRFVISSCVFT